MKKYLQSFAFISCFFFFGCFFLLLFNNDSDQIILPLSKKDHVQSKQAFPAHHEKSSIEFSSSTN